MVTKVIVNIPSRRGAEHVKRNQFLQRQALSETSSAFTQPLPWTEWSQEGHGALAFSSSFCQCLRASPWTHTALCQPPTHARRWCRKCCSHQRNTRTKCQLPSEMCNSHNYIPITWKCQSQEDTKQLNLGSNQIQTQ